MNKKYIKPDMRIVKLHSKRPVLNVVSGGDKFYMNEEVEAEEAI